MDETIHRFLKKVDKSNSCWIWKAQIYPNGYGSFWLNGKNHYAHRASWVLYIGQIPNGLCVCHKCDNPSCVNPDHLFLGTHKENTQDMIKKGRRAKEDKKLSLKDEEELVSLYVKGIDQRTLAIKYDVHQRTIWRYLHKKIPIEKFIGEKNNKSKLKNEDVINIRNSYQPYVFTTKKLSIIYNVSESAIKRIIQRKTWKHL